MRKFNRLNNAVSNVVGVLSSPKVVVPTLAVLALANEQVRDRVVSTLISPAKAGWVSGGDVDIAPAKQIVTF